MPAFDQMRIWIGSRVVTLYRSRATSSHVEVTHGANQLEGRFLVKGKDSEKTISDWLLDQLGLAGLFNAIRLPRGKRLDFGAALLPYCYLTQNSIDQHIIRPKRDDDIRIMVLKLLFGLTTPAYEHECSIIRDIDNEIERNRRNNEVISKFLAGSTATAPEAVRAMMSQLRDKEKRAAQRLARLKDAARATTSFADHQRQQELDAKAAKGDAEEKLQVVLTKQRRAKSRVDEIAEPLPSSPSLNVTSQNHNYRLPQRTLVALLPGGD